MATDGELLQQGLAHHRAGRLAEAAAAYRAVLARDPDNAEAHHLTGVLEFGAGDHAAAAGRFARAVAIAPGAAKYHGNLGAALLATGQVEDAVTALERARAIDPDAPGIAANLAAAWQRAGRAADAVTLCRAVLKTSPDDSGLRGNLAGALLLTGDAAAALTEAEAALALEDGDSGLHNIRGGALRALGRHAEAGGAFERAVALDPGLAEGWVNLGYALHRARRFIEAAAAYGRAIRLRPADAGAHIGLARTRRFQGRPAEALALIRKAIGFAPDSARFHSNLLFHLLGDPATDAAALLEEHREWNDRHAPAVQASDFTNDADPDRPLRIGYVSGDLRSHPVGRLLAPVLAAHDRAGYPVTLYAQGQERDRLSDALKGMCEAWRDCAALDDDALAARVREDEIDILVDLSGHSAENRMPAFARRLAPVQASWLGYQATTGLAAMDWLVTDAVHLPPGNEHEIAERPARLPHGLLVFAPPGDAPDVPPPPSSAGTPVAFCSFNNPGKISPACAAAWARVLDAVPGSTLLLRYRGLEDAGARAPLLEALAEAGVDAARVTVEGDAGYRDVLATYGRADVAFDPFPYSGTMTTLEALWMGVPVVALHGGTIAGRQAASQLAAAGLAALTARDVDGYVALAVALANDPAWLAALRAGMRDRLLASPLCDVAGFTRGLEEAFRMMWRDRCAKVSAAK